MGRHDNRPTFTPNTESWAPNTVEEQLEGHTQYWDEQHDAELTEKLTNALVEKGFSAFSSSVRPDEIVKEIVRELRLTTYV